MNHIFKSFIASACLMGSCWGQIFADFETSEGDFTVVLDHLEAPLAVANFIHLAGKGDDIFETTNGVPFLGAVGHDRQGYFTTPESDAQKLPLTVTFVPSDGINQAMYVIRQSQTVVGAVEEFARLGYHPDITGQDRFRLQLIDANPVRYRITIRYPRNWIDARNQLLRDAPMYRGLPIHRVETGKRFFAGTMTNDPLENPGYRFQQELLRSPGSILAPYGTPFNTAWVLAMDSTGPNRNGSGFFITSAADRSWNGQYTAFGLVEQNAGRSVVQAIANSPSDANLVPASQMVIENITIREIGSAPQAFFTSYHAGFLPGAIEVTTPDFLRLDGDFSLVLPLRPSSQNSIFTSFDFQNYTGGFLLPQPPGATTLLTQDLSQAVKVVPRVFFRTFSTRVDVWPSAEVDLEGASFVLRVNSGTDLGTLRLDFGEDGMSGAYSIDMDVVQDLPNEDPVVVTSEGSGLFTATYSFADGPYQGQIDFVTVSGPLNVDQITLNFDSSRWANNPQVHISNVIRRFSARTTDPNVSFLGYSGIFQQLN